MQVLQRNRVFLLHLLFWCIYLTFNIYQASFFSQHRGYDWSRGLMFTGIQFAFTFTVAYLNYFIFLPRFLNHKKIWRYILEFIIPFGILIAFRVFLQRYMMADSPRAEFFHSHMYVIQVAAITLFITAFVGMLRFAVDWFELEARKREVENEKLFAELNFLRAQINPHFLFNTLNNLYYLAYSKSDNTTEVISRLSQMMRYMIYESNHEKVLLSKEIEYMQNYISLEQLRLNNQVPIEFTLEGETENIWIAPLIFITFLENAFKHGVSTKNNGAWVNISIRMNGKQCTYRVENSKQAAATDSKEGKSGIGLQNVQRRLELSYPDQHQLKVEDTPDQYAVQLDITLS
jgi:two-component system, LytTR family, sensor histidine kinase AlgZ